MFELILTILFVAGLYFTDLLWLKMVFFAVYLILVIPGLYAMIFGAPWLRTSDNRLKDVIDIGRFDLGDRVVDLGCGDGKVIRAVAKRGVSEAIGYEFSIPTYLLAKIKSHFSKSGEQIRYGNFWKKDFVGTDVLICFFLDRTMKDFEQRIWPNLQKGTRVISNEFQMENVEPENILGKVYLYVKK